MARKSKEEVLKIAQGEKRSIGLDQHKPVAKKPWTITLRHAILEWDSEAILYLVIP